MKMPKSITVMKYLGTDGEYYFEIVDDLQYPNLEDRMNYLAKFEHRLWAEYHDYVLDNWKGEDLQYYLRITD